MTPAWCLCSATCIPEMSGYIVVSPTPYFAETDASGNYKIENVPDGKYNVVAWHEGIEAADQVGGRRGLRQGRLHPLEIAIRKGVLWPARPHSWR